MLDASFLLPQEMGLSDDITSLRVHVHGFVQGVGFRDFLVMAAEQQKLDGWVRNRADGSVEALVSGPTKAVEVFVTNATRGRKAPRSAPWIFTTANRPPKRLHPPAVALGASGACSRSRDTRAQREGPAARPG